MRKHGSDAVTGITGSTTCLGARLRVLCHDVRVVQLCIGENELDKCHADSSCGRRFGCCVFRDSGFQDEEKGSPLAEALAGRRESRHCSHTNAASCFRRLLVQFVNLYVSCV